MPDAPKRIQRSRVKGSRLPPNTICVTRPGPFGNLYHIDQHTQSGHWFVQGPGGKPLVSSTVGFGGWNNGPWCVLDGTNPQAQKHLERGKHASALLELLEDRASAGREDRVVKIPFAFGELAVKHRLRARRQLARHFAFEPPEHEGFDARSQARSG